MQCVRFGNAFLFAAGLLVFFTSGCAEKSAEVAAAAGPKKSSTPEPCAEETELRLTEEDEDCSEPDPEESSVPGAPYDLCKAVSANSEMKASHASFVTLLCKDGKLDELRGKFYTGGSTAKINVWSDANKGDTSQMLMGSAMSTTTTPSAYFAMTKLQMTKPSEFKSKGFEVNPDTIYTPSTVTDSSVKYKYDYEKQGDADGVTYEATTKFFTLKSKQAYLVSTLLDKDVRGTLPAFRGIIIINKSEDTTEVFTVSDQTYANNGNHQSTVDKVKSRLGEEQMRMHRNSKDATKAE